MSEDPAFQKPPLHPHEQERLAALDKYAVVNTAPESVFDDMVRLASQICNVPISLITMLTEDSQWFKASHGTDVSETPRDVAFCSYAILQKEMLEVPDATKDPRFAGNPLVTGEPHLRFYASALLETPEGLPLGTLCVLDTKPGQLTAEQKFALQTLAGQVMAQLELRRVVKVQEATRRVYETVLFNTPDLVYVIGTDKHFKYANNALLSMWGRTEAESVGKGLLELGYEPWHAEMHEREIDEVIATRKSIKGEVPFNGTNGRRVYEYIFSPIFAADGSVEAIAGSTRDVTERKEMEEAVRLSERRFRLLSELDEATRDIQDPVEVMKIVTKIVAFHFQASRCLYSDVEEDQDEFSIRHAYAAEGYPNTVGTFSLDVFGPFTASKLRQGQTLVIRDAGAELAQDAGVSAFAAMGVNAAIGVPLIRSRRLVAMMGIESAIPRDWTDHEIKLFEAVTQRSWAYIERARAYTKMRESEEKFRQLAQALPNQVWTSQPDGQLDWFNESIYRYSGLTFEDLVGDKWGQIVHPEDATIIGPLWARALQTGTLYETKFRIRRSDGAYRWHIVRAIPIRGEHGILNWIGTNTDIEDQVRAAEASEAANIAKSEFLATMSHEIRTPMNAVIGLSNLLSMSQPLTPRQREFISTLQISADSLLALINDLLDIAKIEARTIEVEKIPFSLSRILHDLVSMMSVRAREKNLSFVLNAPDIESRIYLGDPARLRQVLLNLCSNAIKFTDSGSVKIDVVRHSLPQGNGDTITISVTDTGIGIGKDQLDSIFHKFVQADSSISRRYGGTGLGLSITKTITEIMGGTIDVISEVGQGSVFTLRLDLQSTAPDQEDAEDHHDDSHAALNAPGQKQRVLLVEDYGPNVMVATTFLEQFGYDYDVVDNGKAAVDRIISGARYCAMLMDLQMHDMDGLQATRMIRAHEETSGGIRTPIIGMTAHALTGDRERCIAAGMDEYIAKPFNPDELQDKLRLFTLNH